MAQLIEGVDDAVVALCLAAFGLMLCAVVLVGRAARGFRAQRRAAAAVAVARAAAAAAEARADADPDEVARARAEVTRALARERMAGDRCPVCLDDVYTVPVTTNCGHVFCTPCFQAVPSTGSGVACPSCRRLVTLLIPVQPNAPDVPPDLAEFVTAYNRRYGMGAVPWWNLERLRDMPNLLVAALGRVQLFPLIVWLRLVSVALGGIVYLLSPLDLLPEVFLGVLGLVDDFAVALLVLSAMASVVRAVVLANPFRQRVH